MKLILGAFSRGEIGGYCLSFKQRIIQKFTLSLFIKAENSPQNSCSRVHPALHTRECEMVTSGRVWCKVFPKDP